MKNYKEISQLLEFYLSSGIDAVFDSKPKNFFLLSSNLKTEDICTNNLVNNDKITVSNTGTNKVVFEKKIEESLLYATNSSFRISQDIANSSDDLESLCEKVVNSDFCQLKKYATNTVFGYGVTNKPDVMIIGEAPGADEDKQGLPFVGVSGQLLDKIFATIGIDRNKNAYITNILKWRPPGNRTPTPEECFICMPILIKQIELIKPKLIVLAGSVAAHAILNSSDGITKIRGYVFDYKCKDGIIKAIPVFHPSYLLRNPLSKKFAYIDVLKIRETLNHI